jgi:Flp pilus assembly protein TadD
MCRLELGQFAESEKDFLALKEKDEDPSLRGSRSYGLGLAQAGQGHFAEAEGSFRSALKGLGESADLHFQIALCLDKQGHFEQAVPELERVLALDPKRAEAMNYLGYSWADRGVRLPEAEGLLKKALDLEPGNPYYLDSLGWACFKESKRDQAVHYLRQAVRGLKGRKGGPDEAVIYEHLQKAQAKILQDPGARQDQP